MMDSMEKRCLECGDRLVENYEICQACWETERDDFWWHTIGGEA
jgi:predicted amidophosphoribosyltransferase